MHSLGEKEAKTQEELAEKEETAPEKHPATDPWNVNSAEGKTGVETGVKAGVKAVEAAATKNTKKANKTGKKDPLPHLLAAPAAAKRKHAQQTATHHAAHGSTSRSIATSPVRINALSAR
jgi:hypothetical protein